MKAAQLFAPRRMEVNEIPLPPEPSAGEVLVRLKGIGICGSDLHYYMDGRIGEYEVRYPSILGHEPVAEVVAVGAGVAHLKTGQIVCVEPAITCGHCEFCVSGRTNNCVRTVFMGGREAPGFFREYAVAPAGNVEPVPESLDWRQATLVEPLAVICHTMELCPVKPGDTVAVLGAGPIGLLTVAMARLSGANRIIAGDRVAHRVALAKRMGADIGIHMPGESLADAVRDLTRGRGADVVYDAAAARETIAEGLRATRAGGNFVLIGMPYEKNMPVDLHRAMDREIRIQTIKRGNHCGHHAMNLLEAGRIPLDVITHRIPLERTPDAFAMLEDYRDGAGKILIENV
jgi:L-iditol 2-dehydrogenase